MYQPKVRALLFVARVRAMMLQRWLWRRLRNHLVQEKSSLADAVHTTDGRTDNAAIVVSFRLYLQ